jgi:hypothetical protein
MIGFRAVVAATVTSLLEATTAEEQGTECACDRTLGRESLGEAMEGTDQQCCLPEIIICCYSQEILKSQWASDRLAFHRIPRMAMGIESSN